MSSRNRRFNRLSKRSASILVAAAASAGFTSSLFAASGTWTFTAGSGQNWSTATNWVSGNVAGWQFGSLSSSSTDFSVFSGNLTTGDGQPFNFNVNMNVNVTLTSMQFTDTNTQTPNGWTLASTTGISTGSITLNTADGSNGVITVNNLGSDTFHTDSQVYVAIYAPLYGTSGLNKEGGGLLRLGGNNSNLSGTINVNNGTLEIAPLTAPNTIVGGTPGPTGPLGNVDPTIIFGGGVLSLRSDSNINLSSKTFNLTANSGVNVDNSVNTLGQSSVSNGGIHSVGTVILSGAGNRTLTVSGSHNSTLNIGALLTSPDNGGAVINNLAPGALVIGTVISQSVGSSTPGFNNGNTTLTLGGTGTTSIGATVSGGDINITGAVAQGSVNLTVRYADVHTLSVGSFNGVTGGLFLTGSVTRSLASSGAGSGSITLFASGGTMNVLAGAIPSGSLTVTIGQLNVNQAVINSLNADSGQLTMGGATVSSGTLTASIDLHGGTLLFNNGSAANIAVNTGTFASASGGTLANTGVTAAVQTLATVTGNLDLGQGSASIRVGTTQLSSATGSFAPTQLDLKGTVVGTGAITKTGLGELRLMSANALTGPMIVQGGTLTGVTQTSGNALSSGAMTLTSGTLRAQGLTGATASVSVPTLAFAGETLDPTRLVVDSSTGGGTNTLNIGTFLGRVAGTTGILTVIPQAGSLNLQEVIHVGFFDPSVNPASTGFRNMLPAYIAAQVSGTNTAVDFLAKDGGSNLVRTAYTGGDINAATVDTIYSTTTAQTINAATINLFALKADGAAAGVGGTGTLIVGDGVRPAGIILDNGSSISIANLNLNSPEAVIWAGGTGGGTISTNFTMNGNITTGGASTLNLTGSINLNGNRTMTIGSGYTVLSGTFGGGNVTKSGPGTLSLTNTNASYAGTLTVNNGTAEITGVNGNLSAGTVILGDNGILAFNKPASLFTFARPIQGTGTVVQNGLGGTLQLTAGPVLSNFANMNLAAGTVLLSTVAGQELPSNMVLWGTSTLAALNMNGRNQTIGGLNGVGTINTSNLAGTATLTVNGGGSWGGSLAKSTLGDLALIKNGAGSTLQMEGNSTYGGQTTINAGTIAISNNAGGNNKLGTATLIFNGGALWPGNNDIPNAVNVQAGGGTMALVDNVSLGTGANYFGTGTLYWVKNNQLFTMNGNWQNFAGTMDFSQAPGTYRFNNTVNNNYGAPNATFAMGNAGAIFTMRQGQVTGAGFNIGALTGGPNATLTGSNNGTGNIINWIVGGLNTSTTFAGSFTDADGLQRVVGLTKTGSGTLTLIGTSNMAGAVNVNNGRLIVGDNGIIAGNPFADIAGNIVVNTNGTFGFAGSGTIEGSKNLIVNDGVFDVTGTSWSNPGSVTFQGTSQLNRTGIFRGNYTQQTGTISPGGGLTGGTVTFGNATNLSIVSIQGGNNVVDILSPGSVGSGFNDLISVTGTLELLDQTAFRISQIDDTIGITQFDSYPIMTYFGTRIGTLNPTISAGFRGLFTLVDNHVATAGAGGTIAIKILSFIDLPSANLTWTGAVTNNWDVNITSNFTENGAQTTFFQLDNVKMDDSAGVSAGSVNLTPGTFKPTLVTINNNTKDYILTGTGNIGGSGGMIKTGTGLLTILNRNNFSGGATIMGSTVAIGVEAGAAGGGFIGSGSVYVSNGTLLVSNNNWNEDLIVPTGSSATIVFNNLGNTASGNWSGNMHGGGTINLLSNGNNNGNGSINLNSNNADATGWLNILPDNGRFANGTIALRSNNAAYLGGMFLNLPQTPSSIVNITTQISDIWTSEVTIGGLQGNGTLQAQSGGSTSYPKRWVIGAAGGDGTFSGIVVDAGGSNGGTAVFSGIIKTGNGSLTLTGGPHRYTGQTVVNGGWLVVDGLATQGQGSILSTAGNLGGTSHITVNGGTFLMRNDAHIFKADFPNVLDDITAGVVLSANTGGHIDFSQVLNYTSNIDPENPVIDRFQPPQGMTVGGAGGTIHGPFQLGNDPNGSGSGGEHTGVSTINPGAGSDIRNGNYGTLTFTELHLGSGGTVNLDVTTPGGIGDVIASPNTVQFAGGTLVVNFNAGATNGATYRLFNAGPLTGAANFDNVILNARRAGGVTGPVTASHFVTSGGSVSIVLDEAAESNSLQWQPRTHFAFDNTISWFVANTWNTNGDQNWKNNSHGTQTVDWFFPNDTVTFSDTSQQAGAVTAFNGTVVLVAPVFPAQTIVTPGAGTGYTFAGTTWGGTTFVGNNFAGNNAFARLESKGGKISGTGALVKNGAGSLVLLTDNDYSGPTSINSGTLQVGEQVLFANAGTGINKFNESMFGSMGDGPVTIASGATLVFARRDAYQVGNNITGGGTLFKVSQSQVLLTGSNSYTGGTVVGDGVIRMGSDNAIPAGGTVAVAVTLAATSSSGSTAGQLNLFGHNLSLNAIFSTGTNNTGALGSGTQGSITNGSVGTSTGTLTIASANFSAALTGNMGLIKNTPAIATMSYQNSSYSGPTQINQGTLLLVVGPGTGVHNSNSNGTYTIASGAALSGNGTVNAPINVTPGSILSPGVHLASGTLAATQVGTLNLGTVILNSGDIRLDLLNGSMDQVNILNTNGLNSNGFLSIAGTTLIDVNNLTAGGFVNAATYTIVNYTGFPLLTSQFNQFALGTTNVGSLYTMTLLNNTGNTSIDLRITRTGPANNGDWNVAGGGSWTAPANWLTSPTTGDVPNAVNAVATFGTLVAPTAARVVTVDSVKSLGTMVFNSSFGYSLTGTAGTTITFDTSTVSIGNAGITVLNPGSHTITAPVNAVDNLIVDVASGATLTLSGSFTVGDTSIPSTGSRNLTKNSPGTLAVAHLRTTTAFDGGASGGTVTINSGRIRVLPAAQGDVFGSSKINALNIAGGATLDLSNNAMIIDYKTGSLGTLLTDVKTMISSGKIVSSATAPPGTDTRIGYRDNNDTSGAGNGSLGQPLTSFAGLGIDDSSMLIKWTYGGDTNLDGQVDINDLLNLATHYNQAGSWVWSQGDFNYDGAVNQADLTLLAKDWQAGVNSGTLGGNLSSLLGGLGLPGDVGVPEPTTFGLVGLGLTGLIARRRRRKA